MSSVFVVDACRTPIGKVKGVLADVRPDHLAADILKASPADVVERVKSLAEEKKKLEQEVSNLRRQMADRKSVV